MFLLRIALGFATSPPPAMSVPGSALVTFDDATLITFPAVQLIDHPLALQEWCPAAPTQLAGFFFVVVGDGNSAVTALQDLKIKLESCYFFFVCKQATKLHVGLL